MSASNQISISCLYAEQRANPWESAVSLGCVSLCVPEWAFTLCTVYIFTYHVSYLCHWVFIMFEVIQRKIKCVYSQSFFQESHRIHLLALLNIFILDILDTHCRQLRDVIFSSHQNKSLPNFWIIFCSRVPSDSAGWLYYECQSHWKLDPTVLTGHQHNLFPN